MTSAVLIFSISFFLILYTYVIYPGILFFAYAFVQLRRDIDYLTRRRNRRAGRRRDEDLPAVTMIVPVYNEEEHLEEKIENVRQMSYPREKLQVIFVSDGSTDRSTAILERLDESGVEVIFKERGGKPRDRKSTRLNSSHDQISY